MDELQQALNNVGNNVVDADAVIGGNSIAST